MAIAVIGGLITSTALTLVIVPAVFTLVDDVERWIGPRVSKVLMSHESAPPCSCEGPAARGILMGGAGLARARPPGGSGCWPRCPGG